MIRCCGVICKTRFCPHCGKSLGNTNPLVELLDYLRRMEETAQKRTATWAARRASGGRCANEPRAATPAERWKAWADSLEALIDGPPAAEANEQRRAA